MEETNSKKGSPVVFIALSLFFVVAPIGSWYYLKQGENFRKSQIDELLPKGDFSIKKIANITPRQIDSLFGEFYLIEVIGDDMNDSEAAENHRKDLFDQFGDRPQFNIIRLKVSEDDPSLMSKNSNQLWEGNLSKSQLATTGINPPSEIAMPFWTIVDIHGRVRGYYSSEDKEKLVVHTAMILPLEKRAKIDLKRDKEI